MPAYASFAVDDRESTPVSHSFVPRGDKNGVAVWKEDQTIPIGARKVTLSMREANGRTKVRLVMSDPVEVVETINGVNVTKVPRTSFADVTFTFSDLSTLQERKNLIGMFANALDSSNTALDAALTNLEWVY